MRHSNHTQSRHAASKITTAIYLSICVHAFLQRHKTTTRLRLHKCRLPQHILSNHVSGEMLQHVSALPYRFVQVTARRGVMSAKNRNMPLPVCRHAQTLIHVLQSLPQTRPPGCVVKVMHVTRRSFTNTIGNFLKLSYNK